MYRELKGRYDGMDAGSGASIMTNSNSGTSSSSTAPATTVSGMIGQDQQNVMLLVVAPHPSFVPSQTLSSSAQGTPSQVAPFVTPIPESAIPFSTALHSAAAAAAAPMTTYPSSVFQHPAMTALPSQIPVGVRNGQMTMQQQQHLVAPSPPPQQLHSPSAIIQEQPLFQPQRPQLQQQPHQQQQHHVTLSQHQLQKQQALLHTLMSQQLTQETSTTSRVAVGAPVESEDKRERNRPRAPLMRRRQTIRGQFWLTLLQRLAEELENGGFPHEVEIALSDESSSGGKKKDKEDEEEKQKEKNKGDGQKGSEQKDKKSDNNDDAKEKKRAKKKQIDSIPPPKPRQQIQLSPLRPPKGATMFSRYGSRIRAPTKSIPIGKTIPDNRKRVVPSTKMDLQELLAKVHRNERPQKKIKENENDDGDGQRSSSPTPTEQRVLNDQSVIVEKDTPAEMINGSDPSTVQDTVSSNLEKPIPETDSNRQRDGQQDWFASIRRPAEAAGHSVEPTSHHQGSLDITHGTGSMESGSRSNEKNSVMISANSNDEEDYDPLRAIFDELC